MAEIFVSPGVYVRERDFSYYVSSIGQSALGLIGETKKGPAMRPTLISNMGEFRETFGNLDPDKQVGYAAKSYFKYANRAYVVRILGADSLRQTWNVLSIISSGSTPVVLASFLVSGSPAMQLVSGGAATSADTTFHLRISTGTTDGYIYSGNVNLVDKTSPVYVETLFPRDNTVGLQTIALQHLFSNKCAGLSVTSASTAITTYNASSPLTISGYKNARTPVIVGNVAGASGEGRSLFTVYTISDGVEANKDIKIAIENINTATTTFDLVVRQFSDTNANPIAIERFSSLSMNPTNANYICKAIGDSRDETGDYELVSKYIYVEAEADAPISGLPYGYNRIVAPMSGGTAFPQFPMTTSYVSTTSMKRQILGLDYETIDPDHLMNGWSSAWDLDKSSTNYIKGFHLNSSADQVYYQVGPSAATAYNKTTAKFLVPVLGGNDGWVNSADTRALLSSDTPTTSEETQWKDALDLLANTEAYDINLLATPGVRIDNAIGSYAIEIAETRADCLYVADMPSYITTAEGAGNVTSSIDSNYACTYWPYVKVYDSDNERDVTIPPTSNALEAIAYTDQVSYPWFAPAGMNRGLLTNVIRAQYKLSQDDRDTLYENKCNPIATFPGQGIVIWGQKTLQTRTTALDRINVRRMMLYAKKVIAGASLYLDFEQNDETTWDQFKALVQPVLDLVKIKRGITDFRVIMDETTNTPDMIERGQMVGQIYIKPTKTAEAILINFNLMAQGAIFEE